MLKEHKLERLLWSIAFPGFGQFLNGAYFKGLVFIVLELIVNLNSNLNLAIIESFYGNIDQAVKLTNYKWLMFYPCIYCYAIWDAYRDASDNKASFGGITFVASAYLGTLGVIYSPKFLGPVWLPIISLLLGAISGYLIEKQVGNNKSNPN